MADATNTPPPTPPPVLGPDAATVDRVAKANLEAELEAKRQQLDETVPGGQYLVNGQLVDANGVPITR